MAALLFAQNEARAAITVAQVTQAAVTTAAATQNTAAFTPVADTLYLMWTIQTIGTGPPTVPTATCANGLAMVQVNTVTFATITTQLKRLTLFRAMKPSGLVNGTCTITWGQTTTGHGHVIVGYNGVDTSGTDGSGAIAQSVTGRTNSATAAAGLSITLAALQAGSTTSGGFSNAVNNANSLTAGAGYTAGTGAAFNTPATSIRAEWNTAGSTTVNMTQSATSHIGGIAVEVKAKPTTTLATGTDPLTTTIAPGDPATDVDIFTLQTSSGTEAITSVTVNLSTNSGVGRLAITDNLGAELGFTATPVAGANTITVAGMSATTALTTFKVRVTPLSHAAMPLPPGAAYAITAPVTAWAGPNTHAGSDTNPNALTIDNLSPAGATATSGSAGSDSVTLGWTTSASADFNTTGGSVLYRWATTAGAEVPAEGSAPAVNSSNGAATVACVLSSAASFALSGIIDGTGGSAGCNTTALAPGTDYIYKIFQKDTSGNYDTGVTIGPVTTTYPVPTTTSISPTSKTLGALGFTLTVNGTNFTPGSIVRFNGLDRVTTYVSPTQLTATIPATDLTTVGPFPITVFNPAPGGGLSNAQTFTVNPAAPSAVTDAASGVTSAVATLNGTVGSNGASTTVSFEYGLTAAYGSSIVATQSPLAAGSPPYPTAAVSAQVIGLNCNTTFHYRVVATGAGTTNGLDGTFTTGSCSAPFPATACAATRFNGDLGCTANDVNITGITLAPGSISSCVSGTPVLLDLDLTVNFAVPDRWDVGIFIANDGNLPTLLPANGGASSCSVAVLPIVPETGSYTFPDLDGVPQGTLDTCGDGNGAINGGTGSGVKRMTGVTMPCYASATSGGQLFVPFAVSWDNQKSPTGSLCTSNLYPVPNTTSKCNAPASSVSIAVVVLPVITKTNGGTEINPGANTTYTVVINNNSGGTLLDMVFTDPAVANLSVTSMSCAAAGGSTCPAMTSAAMITAMQGAGITIPSASLPNNSTLTFTINATVSPGAGIGSHIINTATVTLTGGSSTSASDDDTVVLAPSAAKSFSPGTITEGASSVLTVTLTNPTASPVTGVAFTDTYPAGLVNTPSAGGATTCGGTVTAANNGNSLAMSGGTIPASGSCTVTVNITSATAGSYNNNTGTVTHASGTIPAASATLTVNAAVGGSFVFTDAVCQHNIAFGGPGQTCSQVTWPTQTAGVNATAVYITAVNASNVPTRLHASQARTRDMEFGLSCYDPIANAGVQATFAGATLPLCEASGATPTTWSSPVTTVTFPGGSPSSSVSYTFNYADVGWVELWMRNSAIPTDTGHSNVFVVKPGGFVLSGIQQTAAPNTPNPAAADASGAKFVKAGEAFGVTVTATTCSPASATCTVAGAPTPNYGKEITPEGVKLTNALVTGLGLTNNPAISGTFGVFANGAATGTAFTWNEAGIITLTPSVADANYLSAGDVIGTTSGNVGRFYAAKFVLSGGVIANRTGLAGCGAPAGCGTFTYMGEQMSAVFNLAARAVDGTTPLLNYNWSATPANQFAKLNPMAAVTAGTGGPLEMGAVDSAATRTPFPPCGVTPVHPCLTPAQATTGTFASGEASVTVPFTIYRDNAATAGPYALLDVAVAPQDSDGVIMAAYDRDTVNVVAGVNNHTLVGQTMARFGRLWLGNACGSDKRDLTIPFRAEYWNGSVFITNTDDSLTSIAKANIGLGNHQPTGFDGSVNLTHIPAGPFSVASGLGAFSLLKPTGSPAAGSVDIVFGLGSTTTTNTTFIPAQPPTAGANLSYLRGKWYDTTYDRDPVARAAFGIYCGGGSGRGPIYIRESY